MFKPLKKRRYSEQIAQLIQERILNERIGKGDKLPTERELTQEFQVSRTVIREALRELEVAGLVHIKKGPTGGIFIDHAYHKPFSNALQNLISSGLVTVDHILEVRMLMEPYIFMQAAINAQKEDLKAIQALLKNSDQHYDDTTILKGNNFGFHPLVAKASGNAVFTILVQSVMDILKELAHDFLDLSIERRFLQNHNGIFNAIKQKRTDEIKRLVEEDILDVNENLGIFLKGHQEDESA